MKKIRKAVKQQGSNKNTIPLTGTFKRVSGRNPFAANDADFNGFGIAATPRINFTFSSKSGRADASLFANPMADGWGCGYRYAIQSGESSGESRLPGIHDTRHGTGRQAIEAAAEALLASLDAKYPDTSRLNQAEAALVEELRQWAAGFLPDSPPDEEAKRPLAGLRFVDLFAGIGGFRYPLERLGAKCVMTCEIDRAARETYEANFDTRDHDFPKDITKLEACDVPDHDILVAGFPCQPFSIAGNRKGFDDQRGQLFLDVVRLVEAKQPKFIFLENVGNFVRLGKGCYARAVEDTLAAMGYVVTHKILKASDFGVPQQRERVFFVAIRRDCLKSGTSFVFPVGEGCELTVTDILEPDAPDGKVPLKDVEPDTTRDPESPTQRIGWIRGKRWQSARVMSPDGIGLTLVTNKNSSGNYLVNGKARSLTPREQARMQGFPESFILDPSETQACKQLGNSVAVPVVKAVLLAAANQANFHHVKEPTPVTVEPVAEPAEEIHEVESVPVMLDKVTASPNGKFKGSYLPWAGSKNWSRGILEPHLPPFRKRAIFPFGGVASDALGYADIFDDLHIADINIDLIKAHQWLIEDTETAILELKQLCDGQMNNLEAFNRLRDEFNRLQPGSPDRVKLFLYLMLHCHRGLCRFNRSGGFNASYCYRKSVSTPEAAIRRFVETLGKASFTLSDAVTTIDSSQAGDVVFLDPPYRPEKEGQPEADQYTPKVFSVAMYAAMVAAAERAVARGVTVFAHDHLTEETKALHPNASAILPVQVARRIGKKAGNVIEAVFIYRPKVAEVRDKLPEAYPVYQSQKETEDFVAEASNDNQYPNGQFLKAA